MQVCEANHSVNQLVCSSRARGLRHVRAVHKRQGLRHALKMCRCDCFFIVMFSFSYILIAFFSLGARGKHSGCKVLCPRRITKTIALDCAVQIFNTFENLDRRRIDDGLSTLSFQGLATSRCIRKFGCIGPILFMHCMTNRF